MKDGYKKILIIWLLLYVILAVLSTINTFNGTLDKSILSVGTYPLHISNVILFAFVGNRGEEKLCKIGIFSILIYLVLNILYNLSVFSFSVLSTTAIHNKILTIIYRADGNIITVCEYLALFSLIKGNEKVETYKVIAMLGLIIFCLINLVNNIFPKTSSDLLSNINTTIDRIAMLAKYAAIIFCLTDSNYFSRVFVTDQIDEIELDNSIAQATNQIVQTAPVSAEPQIQAAPVSQVQAPPVTIEQPTQPNVVNNEMPILKTGPVANNTIEQPTQPPVANIQ